MSDQGGEIVPLPQGIKLEKPKTLIGVIDTDAVNVVFF